MRATLAILIFAIAAQAEAQKTISAPKTTFLRGKEITPEHVVYGTVSFAGRNVATVNLGFGHGLKPYRQLLICRRLESRIVPITVMTVKKVYAERSYGTLSIAFRVKATDYALIPAEKLDIWGPDDRLTKSSRIQLMRRLNGNRYDTRNFSLSLTKELAYDDAKKTRDQSDGAWGAFQINLAQFKVKEATDDGAEPADDNPQAAVGLTDQEGETELLRYGFSKYMNNVIYEGGPKMTGEELVQIQLDPRTSDAGLAYARARRQILNDLANRLFHDPNKVKFSDFTVPGGAKKNPY